MVTKVEGGLCAAKGFLAGGVHCGIRKNQSKKDLALIYSTTPASAAAVYTRNLVKGAPIFVTQEHLKSGTAQAVICNSGNTNTCNANGVEVAKAMCGMTAAQLGLQPEDVAVASTGVIGKPLELEPIRQGLPKLASALFLPSADVAQAIMTTDTTPKEIAVEFVAGGKVCRLGGIAKGSGMIHPSMATMLVFLTTDCAIDPAMLQKALRGDVDQTFNMISVDGDTSTNDMVLILANGQAGNTPITQEGQDFAAFMEALNTVTVYLCRAIAADGEGATRLLECTAVHAPDVQTARTVAKSVVCSSLLKAAMFAADANWGRVLCVIGYSGAQVDVNRLDVAFRSQAGQVQVCQNGAGVEFSEEQAKEVLSQPEVEILVDLKDGTADATAWGCDLTYEYVRINGDYRT